VGYQLRPGTVGAKVGSVTAVALDANDATNANASASCDNTVHSLVWMMKLSGAGQTFDVPVIVDQNSGTEVTYSSFRRPWPR